MTMEYFTLFFLGLVITGGLSPVLMALANKFNLHDVPSERKIHKHPVPVLGGIAVYFGFVIPVAMALPVGPKLMSIILGGTLLGIVGLIDDLGGLSSIVRLLAQFAAASMVIMSGIKVSFLPHTLIGDACAYLITAFWIIGIINALNFFDGMDGVAGGICSVAAGFFFILTCKLGQANVAMPAIALAGASLGFLVFNFRPAKIYLGDSGSTFMGFLLACFALYGEWSARGPVIALGIPVLILGILIFDMCYITVSRIRRGVVTNFREWLDYTGKDHFHHRLVSAGFTVPQAAVFIYVTCTILGLSALLLEKAQSPYLIIISLLQAVLILAANSMIMLMGKKIAVGYHGIDEGNEDELFNRMLEMVSAMKKGKEDRVRSKKSRWIK
ncbi:MAG: undecaprenyl/decaprenyl-phosphate alpha-N-acetylglucosaminyl 1-phosphate transferase [Candidatus Omnitrophica bacterium]|nr:undecaprenyl/decaprenyl-phosphate alpha-N-acetylglucosaminyl 1-phosphate transferase [Candidatus Omnitrophota bacterium]